jgi:hypothetical protein
MMQELRSQPHARYRSVANVVFEGIKGLDALIARMHEFLYLISGVGGK